ncbi:MAG: hypothetical protein JXA01_03650 [Dehalococcoidia bacterium]|nr:hypothetical protein [Dehalococcoidia bacterium]
MYGILNYMAALNNSLLVSASQEPPTGMVAGLYVIFSIAIYVYLAICLQKIAEKTNTPNGWLAWIPVANIYLMCVIAGKAWWWVLLCLIPYVNIIFIIILWWKIAEARAKPGWWGLLLMIPLVNIVIIGMLAFSD